MPQPEPLTVTGKDGLRGTLETSILLGGNRTRTLVRLDSGKQVLVPSESLVRQDDGSYYLPATPGELEDELIEETPSGAPETALYVPEDSRFHQIAGILVVEEKALTQIISKAEK